MPTTSKTPMTASSEAAAVMGMPWSWAAGTKWVWIRPLVEAPQIAKVPARSQNGPVRTADSSTWTVRRAAPWTGAGFGTNSFAPYGFRPTSAGWSRSSSQTKGMTVRAARDTVTAAGRQSYVSMIHDSSGRKISWPEAEAAVRMPVTRPRRSVNQRLVTVAAKASAMRTGAQADQQAPAQHQLPGRRHPHGQAGAQRDDREGDRDDPPDAEAVHQRGGEGGRQPVQREVDGDGGPDRAARPVELGVERVDEQPGQGAEGGGADDRHEGDSGDEPGPVDGRARGPAGLPEATEGLDGINGIGGVGGICRLPGSSRHTVKLPTCALPDRLAGRTAFARIGP